MARPGKRRPGLVRRVMRRRAPVRKAWYRFVVPPDRDDRAGWSRRAGEEASGGKRNVPTLRALNRPGLGSELLSLVDVFSPSQPISDVSRFDGRAREIEALSDAVELHRSHVHIYGARGVGKTSMALVFKTLAAQAGYLTAYVSCGRNSTVDSIFRSVAAAIPHRFDRRGGGPRTDREESRTFADLVAEPLTPQLVGELFARIVGTRLVIVLDEFDRIEDETLIADVAEILKVLSDQGAPVSVIVISTGEDEDRLSGEHPSVSRLLFKLRVQLMSTEAIIRTLRTLSAAADITMSPDVVAEIVALARGNPYLSKLVALNAARAAALRQSRNVAMPDLNEGLNHLANYLEDVALGHLRRMLISNPSMIALFDSILKTPRNAGGVFSIAELAATGFGESISVVRDNLKILASGELPILQAVGSESDGFYRFASQTMELSVAMLRRSMSNGEARMPAAGQLR